MDLYVLIMETLLKIKNLVYKLGTYVLVQIEMQKKIISIYIYISDNIYIKQRNLSVKIYVTTQTLLIWLEELVSIVKC